MRKYEEHGCKLSLGNPKVSNTPQFPIAQNEQIQY